MRSILVALHCVTLVITIGTASNSLAQSVSHSMSPDSRHLHRPLYLTGPSRIHATQRLQAGNTLSRPLVTRQFAPFPTYRSPLQPFGIEKTRARLDDEWESGGDWDTGEDWESDDWDSGIGDSETESNDWEDADFPSQPPSTEPQQAVPTSPPGFGIQWQGPMSGNSYNFSSQTENGRRIFQFEGQSARSGKGFRFYVTPK